MEDKQDWANLSPKEKALKISVVKLIRHFRGLEKAGLLQQEEARKLIGAVFILEKIAKGEFKEKPQEEVKS